MCLFSFLKWGSIGYSLGIVQWDFTSQDHLGNSGRVSGSGPVMFVCVFFFSHNASYNFLVGYSLSLGLIMSLDKLESFPIRFTGKNYSAWEFQFKLFVKGKELWGHIDGSVPAP